jgi:hypothetical protein
MPISDPSPQRISNANHVRTRSLSTSLLSGPTGFREAAEDYRGHGGREADALFNFADKQGEVVLHARLLAHEAKGMVAEAPDFDDAYDQTGAGEEARDGTFRKLTERDLFRRPR